MFNSILDLKLSKLDVFTLWLGLIWKKRNNIQTYFFFSWLLLSLFSPYSDFNLHQLISGPHFTFHAALKNICPKLHTVQRQGKKKTNVFHISKKHGPKKKRMDVHSKNVYAEKCYKDCRQFRVVNFGLILIWSYGMDNFFFWVSRVH